MEYTEFIGAIENELRKNIKKGVTITVNSVLKNNSIRKTGVTLQRDENEASPTIYLEEYFAAYKNGCSVEKLANEIIHFYELIDWQPEMNLSQTLNFELAKDRIVPKMINKDLNKELLEVTPYVEWMDLAIVFYLLMDVSETGMTSMLIQDAHLKEWKIGKELLYQISMENAMNLLPAELLPINVVMLELCNATSFHECNLLRKDSEQCKDSMYILTNNARNLGAVCITYPFIAQMVAELLGESYFILPSSIHEMIIVPQSKSIGYEAFADMISEINITQVIEEEILAEHAYYYDKDKKMFFCND